jgi:DUF1365 family protein
MTFNSCLYEMSIMHCRIRPKRHKFTHKIFMFYLDLDEIDALSVQIPFLSRNKANVYNFCDDDHMDQDGLTIREKLNKFLQSKGIVLDEGKVMLLTNLRVFGYIFNPVSFYFCFNAKGTPICVVPEIGNTFGEIKPFLLGPDQYAGNKFISQQRKHFYISPFISADIPLDFELNIPDEKLNIKIDDFDEGGKFLYTAMSGNRRELTKRNLGGLTLKYPLITLKVIFLIHMHALALWLKKVPYYAKTSEPHLQKEMYRAWNRSSKEI